MWLHGRSPGGISASGGNHLKTVVPNSSTSAIPATNSGSAASISSTNEELLSKIRSRWTAARMPIPNASGIETIAEQSTRKDELTSAGPMTVDTGRLDAIDVP